MVLRPNQWQGRPAFVIGGGASLRGFDFSQIKDTRWHTIGANAAYRHHPDVVVAMDTRFLELVKDRSEWRNCPSIKVAPKFCERKGRDLGGALYLMDLSSDGLDGWSHEFVGGLKGTNNTGAFAVQIADVLGADPIFLLGFDLYGDGKKTANYHEEYPPSWGTNACVYDQYGPTFLPALQHARGRIVNCNPESNLYYFPRCEVAEALEIARGEKSYRDVFPCSRQIGTTAGIFTIDAKTGTSASQPIEETRPPNVILGELAESRSNINEHLMTLRDLGKQVDSVLEFGTGSSARSTVAWLAARVGYLQTWDIKSTGSRTQSGLEAMARMSHSRLEIRKGDTADVHADQDFDLLFVDSRRSGRHLSTELTNNHERIRRYIVMHSIVTFGWNAEGQVPGTADARNCKLTAAEDGLLPAIFGFLSEHHEWKVKQCYPNNNGLLVLERVSHAG